MKRRRIFVSSLIVLSLVLSLVFEAFVLPDNAVNAAEEKVVSLKASKLKKAKANTDIIYGGKKLSKKGFYVVGKYYGDEYEFIYVPAKVFAKKAGIKLSVKKNKVTLSKDGVKVTFTIGKTAYTLKGGSETMKESFVKSVKKNKTLYVPINVFAGLLENTGVATEYYVEYFCDKTEIVFNAMDSAVVSGGWADTETLEVPVAVRNYFTIYNADYQNDVKIVPMVCIKKQIVAGTNYAIVCRVTGPEGKEEFGVAIVYVDLQGDVTVTDYGTSGIETNFNGLDGGWRASDEFEIDDKVKTAFSKAMEGLVGVDYKPIAVLGQQVVAGKNYCVLCSAKGVYPGAEEAYALVYVYVGFDGSAQLIDIAEFLNKKVTVPDDDPVIIGDPEPEVVLGPDEYMCLSGNFYEVYTPAALKEFTKEEELPDGNVKTYVACIGKDMVIDFEIKTLGQVMVSRNVTVTIEKDALLQAEVFVMDGAQIIVKDGGRLWTTQAGENAMRNNGSIIIEKGGELRSMFGGTITNNEGGKLTIDGEFQCGCNLFEGVTSIWFKNFGEVNGNGKIFVYATNEGIDLDKCSAEVKKMLGDKTEITVGISE
jgi:hypothetical protein